MGGGAMFTSSPVAGAKLGRNIVTNDFLSPHHHNQNRPFSSLSSPHPANFCPKQPDSFVEVEREIAHGFYQESIFGPVPSQIEVEKAMSDFGRFMDGLSTSNSGLKLVQQVNSVGYTRIVDAYHMLQTEPPVQKMVISLSSDQAVWNAILSNKAVQDLQGSVQTAKEEAGPLKTYNEEADLALLFMKWIIGITKSKIVDFLDKIGLLIDGILKPAAEKANPTSDLTDLLEEKVRSSLLLSVVILLIVVVTRSHESPSVS